MDKLSSKKGDKHVVAILHKNDPLPIVTDIYRDFNALLSTKSGENESFRYFGMRLEVQLATFNSYKNGSKPESLVSLMLLSNADLEDSQHVSILDAAVSSAENKEDGSRPSKLDLLKRLSEIR